MIIYWSMILWIPIIYCVYSLSNKEEIKLADYKFQQGIQNKLPWIYAVLIFGYFIFWIGMRKYVGDTSQYIKSFNKISTDFSTAWSQIDWDGKAPGFYVFNAIFKCFISSDFQVWLMFIAIISCVPIMVILRKYSSDFFISAFSFIVLMLNWPTNGMRQFICVAVLFFCCDWIKDGKFLKFLLIIFILSTVHTSTLLMIPVYFVARSEPWKRKIALFIFAIILICICAEPFFGGVVEGALSGTAYEGETQQFAEDDGVNPIRVLFYAVPPIIAYINRKKISEYYDKYPLLPMCINMSVVTAALYLIGMFTSGILIGRLPIFTEVYDLLLIPYLLYICVDKEERWIVKCVVVCAMALYFYLTGPSYYHSVLTGTI